MIGYALCGSFCTLSRSVEVLTHLKEKGYDVLPIMSEITATTDTRFGKAANFIARVESICGRPIIRTIPEAEPLGPARPLEALVICPCTGNTLAKLANGITDTPVCMAAKAHLRSDRPLLITLASNDAMSANLCNIGTLLSRKSVYFTPMVQDDPTAKPHSLVADFSLVPEALEAALEGRQLRPVFLEKRGE
ncbi:MAG: dipicolinate synthase subunit B [Clostridia bacterium]|nr:dipicolinate synthase subunit B [Clostridia bacterium]